MEFCYRRNLPHWRQDQVTYFVTWRFGRGREDLVACNVDNDSDLSSRNEGGRPSPNLPLVRGRDFRRYRFQCYSPLAEAASAAAVSRSPERSRRETSPRGAHKKERT